MAKTQEQDDFGISVRLEGDASAARVIITERCDPATLSVQLLGALLRQHDVEIDKAVEARLEKIIDAYRADRKPRQDIVAKVMPAVHGEDGTVAVPRELGISAGFAQARSLEQQGGLES